MSIAFRELAIEFLSGCVVPREEFDLRRHLTHLAKLIKIRKMAPANFTSGFEFAAQEKKTTLPDRSLGRTGLELDRAVISAESSFIIAKFGPTISKRGLHRARFRL